MRVAIDATPLTVSTGGIARYTLELSRALAEQFPEDEVFLISGQVFTMPSPAPLNLRLGHGPVRLLEPRWWLWGVQREMSRTGAQVFHGTHFEVPLVPVRPSVMTVLDLSPWMEPAWHLNAGRVRRRAPVLLGLGLATMVVTPSEAVRKQAMERFRIHPDRIVSTPLAAAPHFRPVPGSQGRAPYLLFTGVLEPRKNLSVLLDAWREVRRRHEVDLVLAGRRRVDFPQLPPAPGLHLLGEVPDEELPALYSGALACVYPSLYEGFGLPVLEAMQCGAAVIASNDPAVAETAGGAALLLDPRDPRAWVEALSAAVERPESLAKWKERSLARARAFSWACTARLTREVYVEAIHRFGS